VHVLLLCNVYSIHVFIQKLHNLRAGGGRYEVWGPTHLKTVNNTPGWDSAVFWLGDKKTFVLG
jgi:hypothetical protein